MSDTIDIDTLKSHLGTIANARRDIIVSSDTVEDKQTQLTLLDKENDELNQSIDIFFRLMEYTATTDIQKINELLLSLENGTVDIISKFAPALYQDMAQHFSSNTGLSALALCKVTAIEISNYDDLKSHFDITPFGSFITVSLLSSVETSFLNTSSFSIRFLLNGNNFNFSQLFLVSTYAFSRLITFDGGSITKSLGFDFPLSSWHSSLFVNFFSCFIHLSDGSYISINSIPSLSVFLFNTVIKKSENYNNGLLISTNGRTVNVSLTSVTLADGLQWSDIVDDINNINFI